MAKAIPVDQRKPTMDRMMGTKHCAQRRPTPIGMLSYKVGRYSFTTRR
jgi:hypothetical protein